MEDLSRPGVADLGAGAGHRFGGLMAAYERYEPGKGSRSGS